MNLAWPLIRALLASGLAAVLDERRPAESGGANPSGTSILLVAAAVSALIVLAPGLFIGLLLAGLAPAAP